jgi:glycine dehydrogenase subunit 1
MVEIGEGIMKRVRYAAGQLDSIDGVKAPLFDGPHFKEFVVNFDGTGRSAEEINRALLARGIFGGRDLKADFPQLGECALYCVTEMHTREDIDRLVSVLREEVS